MKRVFFILSVLTLVFCFSCKKKKADDKTILIGASPVPHAEMLKCIAEDLKKEGYTLTVKEFTDYVTPNEALEAGEIDANFFQHIPYMNTFNADRNFHLVNVLGVHIEPMALFSRKYAKLDDLKKGGATIALPNDPTNEGRALLLLQSAGLIMLRNASNILSTPADIAENKYSIKFREVEAASLPRMLSDVDGAVINGNYAIPSGLSINGDGLFVESGDSPYVNIISVKAGNESSAKIQALVKACKNGKIKKYIESTYPGGEVICVL